MKIDIDPKLAENTDLTAIVKRANQLLLTLPGGQETTAVWRPVPEMRDNVALELHWKDPDVMASRPFSTALVANLDNFETMMRRYWGDFLATVSHRLGARVRESIAAQDDQ